jgi:putative oxidoreductase
MSLSSLNKFGDAATLVLRVVVGAIFIGHGMMKFGSFSQPAAGMNLVMMLLAVAEPIGGAALILGVLARWASLGLAIVMVGAIYTKQFVWGGGFIGVQNAWEFEAVLFAAALVLACYGAGRYSVDAMLRKA